MTSARKILIGSVILLLIGTFLVFQRDILYEYLLRSYFLYGFLGYRGSTVFISNCLTLLGLGMAVVSLIVIIVIIVTRAIQKPEPSRKF